MCRNVNSCNYHINLPKLNPVHMLSGSFPFSHFFLPWGAELLLCSCGYHRKQDVIQERACWMDSCNIFSKLLPVQLYDTSMCLSSRSGEPWNRKHDYWDKLRARTHTHTHKSTNYFSSFQGWGLTSLKKPFHFSQSLLALSVFPVERPLYFPTSSLFWGADCVNHAKWV